MVACGDADAMVTGTTRGFTVAFDEISRVIDPSPHKRLMGLMIVVARGRTVFIADTNIHEVPTAEELADIAVQTAACARQFGHDPRVALLSFSAFGQPMRAPAERCRAAFRILDGRMDDFETDAEKKANQK